MSLNLISPLFHDIMESRLNDEKYSKMPKDAKQYALYTLLKLALVQNLPQSSLFSEDIYALIKKFFWFLRDFILHCAQIWYLIILCREFLWSKLCPSSVWLSAYICNWLSIYLAIFLSLFVGFRPGFQGGHLAPSDASFRKGNPLYDDHTKYLLWSNGHMGMCKAGSGIPSFSSQSGTHADCIWGSPRKTKQTNTTIETMFLYFFWSSSSSKLKLFHQAHCIVNL